MVCVISVRRVTWLPASHMWLSEGAEDSIFLRTVKNRSIFREFYAWFFMNTQFISRFASVFNRYRSHISKHSRPHPLLAVWIERSDWSIFEFLARDFPKTSCIGHNSAFNTLFPSFIIYSWYHIYSGVDGQLTTEAILMYAHHAQ